MVQKAADELLHTLATALEEILEEYEDGEFDTLGELLDFYIDDLKERLLHQAELDERDAMVKILEDWEEGKIRLAWVGTSYFETQDPSMKEAERKVSLPPDMLLPLASESCGSVSPPCRVLVACSPHYAEKEVGSCLALLIGACPN